MSKSVPILVACALASIQVVLSCADEIRPAADAPQPLAPEESLKLFRVEDGFRVELVAAEPFLADPVAICFDASGSLFACEIHGYNIDGHFDVQELNKTGTLDKTVRRIPAAKWAQEKAKTFTYGKVKKLVDTDGDGQFDRSSLFADKLPPCYGVLCARGGVIALCAPDIYYLADRDGDGRAEIRDKLFTGFNEGELWSRSNHLVWGLDNWVYACSGRGPAKTITGPNLKNSVRLGNTGYRFKPDGSELEAATGSAGGFGLGLSDWGDQFLIHNSTNGLHVTPVPYHYSARNPFVPSPRSDQRASTYDQVFPISQPHPWRTERGRQKAWRDFYGQGEATPNGSFTAACSPTFYRGSAFPTEYRGNLFACESQQNLINRAVPKRQGSRIVLKRPEGFEQQEFLASTEGWFRPVNLATGPDGGLYIVDMYREIIEDYSAIPRYLQQQYGLNQGGDRGRIWRVSWKDAPKARKFNLGKATMPELVAAISHANVVWRETAQRLLVQRGDKSCVNDLEHIVSDDTLPQAKLHALYTLDGLDVLSPTIVAVALSDEHFAVRLHGLRLADRRLDKDDGLLNKVVGMIGDPDAAVRLQLALTLGETNSPRATTALAELAGDHLNEDWMQSAILSSVHGSADRLLGQLLRNHADGESPHGLVRPLCAMVGARQNEQRIANLLTTVASLDSKDAAALQRTCLEGLLRGLDERPQLLEAAQGRDALGKLLTSPSPQVNLLAYRAAKLLKVDDLSEVGKMFAAASDRALDVELGVGERRAAIDLLTDISFARLKPVATKLLDARQPIEIQLAAVRAISNSDDPQAGALMLDGWKRQSPQVQDQALKGIFSRQNRILALLDAIEKGRVLTQVLSSLRRLQLMENPNQRIRRRATALLSKSYSTELRDELMLEYRETLEEKRDVTRGQKIFTQHCAACHKVRGQGHDVGPLLSSAVNRPDESLLNEILDPSSRVTQGFRTYSVVTVDGRIFNGVLSSESATSITLSRDKGQQHVILRKDIEEMTASSKSLMPDDLHKSINSSDMANLLGYIRDVFGPARPSTTMLFDDDARFVELLTNGSGTASIDTDDAFSGKACLSVTPPQRYSDRISGWQFPIVERPGPGQFRYLRLAWKSQGDGVMVELAASGRWPDSNAAERRYYSGKNTTKWQAHLVSREAPGAWAVVTVDLWKDCGAFTLTGIAPTAMGGKANFDRIELLQTLDDVTPNQ